MDFAALKQELADRGFNHISDTRRGLFINEARAQLDGMYLWPYRRTSATATAGQASVTIADLDTVESVVDLVTNAWLDVIPLQEVTVLYGATLTPGTPEVAYVDGNAVGTAPRGGQIQVAYYKRTPDLTGTDTPLAPTEFHPLIVRMAQQLAYLDTDNALAAQGIQPWIDQPLSRMLSLLGGQQVAGPTRHMYAEGSCDG